MRNKQHYLGPVLIGGVVAGVLSSVPIINYVNCIFCMWMLLGAGLSVMLVQQKAQNVDTAEGAIIGALSGVVCAGINWAFQAAIMAIWGASMIPAAAQGQFGDDEAMAGGMMVVIILGSCLFMLIIYPLFGALGGLFGALIFKPAVPPQDMGGGPYGPPPGGGGYGQPAGGGYGPTPGGGYGPPPGGGPPPSGWGS